MKEKYVKPEVELIEFELTEAIASCAAQVANWSDLTSCSLKEPFASLGNFGEGETQCTQPIKGYCYFTSTASMAFSS